MARGEAGVEVDRQGAVWRAAGAINVGGMVQTGGVTANKIARASDRGRPRVAQLAMNLGRAEDREEVDFTDAPDLHTGEAL